ncbi:hypothetical protein QBC39DRAFT_296258 [Podospora conica]|nr:hypothetical protein QBC39DRAFT_296258 [Schizothecium conicum]
MPGALPIRHAVGESAFRLGTLYDAHRDVFLHQSLFADKPPEGAVELTPSHTTTSTVESPKSFQERCGMIEVNPDLGASILSGLCPVPDGWKRFLLHHTQGPVLRHRITTFQEKLDIMATGVKEALNPNMIDAAATHVLTGVSWGADFVIRAQHVGGSHGLDEGQVTEDITAALTSLTSPRETSDSAEEIVDSQHLDLTIFGDTILLPGTNATTFSFNSARDILLQASANLSEKSGGKGTPITYTLMPLTLLSYLGLVNITGDISVPQPKGSVLANFFTAFDELNAAHQEIVEYLDRCKSCRTALPKGHLALVAARPRKVADSRDSLKNHLAHALQDVRLQWDPEDSDPLQRLFDWYLKSDISASALKQPLIYSVKLDFVDAVLRRKAVYIGIDGPPVGSFVQDNTAMDIFVLYYSDISNQAQPEDWSKTRELLEELLRNRDSRSLVVVNDCDLTGESLDRSYIAQFRHGRVYVDDILEHRRVLSVNCVMRCSEAAISPSNHGKPLNRCPIKVPCPSLACDGGLRCNWICSVCRSPVEYAHVDNRIYCDCGESLYDAWEFQCRDPNHGPGWMRYDAQDLEPRLKGLQPSEQLNVLILGETGVGKSTWINAFVNYLTHDSLEEALDTDELKWVIPSSFSTQLKDPYDSQGRFVQRDIKIGSHKDERDGARGQSATQRTCVYTVGIGNTRVRLIDTPGIGDTRGLDQDNKNMADILRVLRTYNQLHGILILLKPNAARLTVMFRFCIKQLLTHLHKNAAQNIVFGFTNTRGSNYKPGDTFKPLETLLTEYTKIELGLYEHNVFCFDSESFRYLAARKQGVEIGSIEDNARSWEYSVAESKRLVSYFQGLTPHSVRSTINLNETRDMIIRLTEPMAEIAQKIQNSIAINNDQIAELKSTRLSRVELEKRLYVQRESVESYEVGQPRTVCTHHDCVEVRSDFDGRDEKVIVYKTMCHKPCYLGETVKRNEKGHPELAHCVAIGAGGICHVCSHHFMDHMHIYYDYRAVTHRHKDEAVNQHLIENASDIELQQEAIQMRQTAIEEFGLEYKQVQDAAIHFGFFLKRHAIEPYNDATVEYVDHLIHQERMKIKSGGRAATLEMLERYKAEHLERVAILTKAMESGDDESQLDDHGVKQLVDGLFGLPHFGEDLKRIVDNNERAVDAAFREKTFNVSTGGDWAKRGGGKRKVKKGKARAVESPTGSGSTPSQSENEAREVGSSGTQKETEAQVPRPMHHEVREGKRTLWDKVREAWKPFW